MKTKLSLLIALSLALPLQAISVKELLKQDAIPAISGVPGARTLDLTNLNIDSLEGLREIPGIETVSFLKLGNNTLTSIPSNAFTGLTIRGLGLMNNKISSIESNAFAGSGLKIILLNGNQLRDVEKDSFAGIKPLFVSVGHNPLKKGVVSKMKKQMPWTMVFTPSLTRKNLEAAGIATAIITAILIIIGVVVTTQRGQKGGQDAEEWEEYDTYKQIYVERRRKQGMTDSEIEMQWEAKKDEIISNIKAQKAKSKAMVGRYLRMKQGHEKNALGTEITDDIGWKEFGNIQRKLLKEAKPVIKKAKDLQMKGLFNLTEKELAEYSRYKQQAYDLIGEDEVNKLWIDVL